MRIFTLLIYLFIINTAMLAQPTWLTVMTYNLENAFDTTHDEGKDDLEWCEGGMRRWSHRRLYGKLSRIAKVIAAAGDTRPIDIIGLCEVENDSVMTALTRKTALASMGYKYIMTDSNDPRGIDVALMYSHFTFHPIDTQYIHPVYRGTLTRDILHVTATTSTDQDTLDVYVLHLPSKLGGGDAYRKSMDISTALRSNIDSVSSRRQHPNIIVMGDFNAESNSQQLATISGTDLVDISKRLAPGTYCYHGAWQTIDHILISSHIAASNSRIIALPFMLTHDNKYHGMKPRRSYTGYKYDNKGISDHLPIATQLRFK